jgi:hypothetical protein
VFASTNAVKELWQKFSLSPLFPNAVGPSESNYSVQLRTLLILTFHLRGIFISSYLRDICGDLANIYFVFSVLLTGSFIIHYAIVVLGCHNNRYLISLTINFLGSLIHPSDFIFQPHIYNFSYTCLCNFLQNFWRHTEISIKEDGGFQLETKKLC